MRNISKSPIGARIDAITSTVEEALKNIPNLLKRKKQKSQKSYINLKIPKRLDHSKTTAGIASQNTGRSQLNTDSNTQLRLMDLNIPNPKQQTLENKGTQKNNNDQKKQEFVSFRSYRKKLNDLNSNQKCLSQYENIPTFCSNLSPISNLQKSSKHLNFRSLSNLHVCENTTPRTSLNNRSNLSPTGGNLDLLQIIEHQGYHQIYEQKEAIKRAIISEQLKHRMALQIRQRLLQNSKNVPNVKRHQRENSTLSIRDTLIRRVTAIAGINN